MRCVKFIYKLYIFACFIIEFVAFIVQEYTNFMKLLMLIGNVQK